MTLRSTKKYCNNTPNDLACSTPFHETMLAIYTSKSETSLPTQHMLWSLNSSIPSLLFQILQDCVGPLGLTNDYSYIVFIIYLPKANSGAGLNTWFSFEFFVGHLVMLRRRSNSHLEDDLLSNTC